MVLDDGRDIQIVDFGLAETIRSTMAKISVAYLEISGTGPFMSPEQWKGTFQDGRTDQYALAIVAYHLITGQLPFTATQPLAMRECALNEQIPQILDVPDCVNQALQKATAKEMDDRFATCGAFMSALSGDSTVARTRVPVGRLMAKPQQQLPTQLENSLGMQFVLIRPGVVEIGSDPDDALSQPSERPRHTVRVTSPFYLGVFPVTQSQFQAVTAETPASGFHPDHPVHSVTWHQAMEFCYQLQELDPDSNGYRLPTEAEWEYACRAESVQRFSFGDDATELSSYGWYADNSNLELQPVGQKQPNGWGLHDMHGNVYEWVFDRFGVDYYEVAPTDDPRGPETGGSRVMRGGSFNSEADGCRSAHRGSYIDGFSSLTIGFRLILCPS